MSIFVLRKLSATVCQIIGVDLVKRQIVNAGYQSDLIGRLTEEEINEIFKMTLGASVECNKLLEVYPCRDKFSEEEKKFLNQFDIIFMDKE